MIRVDIIDDYINYELSKSLNRRVHLDELSKGAIADGVPIIKPEMEGFLITLLAIAKPKTLLELGSAVGYSAAVFMNASDDLKLFTVEKEKKLATQARANLDKLGFNTRYELYNDDILVCEEIKRNKYDFIFVDAAKSYYNEYFDLVKPLLNEDGILVFDNVLHGGDIAKSKYAINRRQRTIHIKMKSFVSRVLSDDNFDSTLLSISDGVILAKKKRGK